MLSGAGDYNTNTLGTSSPQNKTALQQAFLIMQASHTLLQSARHHTGAHFLTVQLGHTQQAGSLHI